MPQHRKQVTYSQRPTHAARSAHARGERQFRTYDTSYIRPKKSKAPSIIAVAAAVVVIVGLAWGAVTLFNSCSAPVELLGEGEEATVVVAEGDGAKAIGENLQEARLLASASDFTKRVNERGVGSQLKPGTYTFSGGMALDQVIDELQAGPKANALTIPEGSTLAATAQSVAGFTGNRITAEAFTAAASDASAYAADYPFLAGAGKNSLEGFLFPKTYDIGEDATADSVVRMMLDQFQTETAGLDWSYPQGRGLSVYDALKLASIVEKESSGDAQVRAQVASVFYNRLGTEGAPTYGYLQSDATTAYELGKDPAPADLENDTPYNTYKNKGLPPTPICSPGLDCLRSACSPAQTDYFFFYFAPDESGTMQYHFSETYEEHQETFS